MHLFDVFLLLLARSCLNKKNILTPTALLLFLVFFPVRIDMTHINFLKSVQLLIDLLTTRE